MAFKWLPNSIAVIGRSLLSLDSDWLKEKAISRSSFTRMLSTYEVCSMECAEDDDDDDYYY